MTSFPLLAFLMCFSQLVNPMEDERGRRLLESTKMHRELIDSGTVFLRITVDYGQHTYQTRYRCQFEGHRFRVEYLDGPGANPLRYGGASPMTGEPWFIDLWDGERLLRREFEGRHADEDVWKYLANDELSRNITNFFYPPTIGLLPHNGMFCADSLRTAALNGTVTESRTIQGTSNVEVKVEYPHPSYKVPCQISLIVDESRNDSIIQYEYRVKPIRTGWEGCRGEVELMQVGDRWYPKRVVHHNLVYGGIESMTLTIDVTEAHFGETFPPCYFTLAGIGYQPGDFLFDMATRTPIP